MTEKERMKWLGLTIPNENDGKIQGTIERMSPSEIDKDNARGAQACEPPGVWFDEDYEDNENDDPEDCICD